MNRRGMITLTAPLLGIALAAAGASNVQKRDQCYGPCYSSCAVQHSCVRPDASRNCFINFNKCKAVCRTSCGR
jgi:hypothetical protein